MQETHWSKSFCSASQTTSCVQNEAGDWATEEILHSSFMLMTNNQLS